MKKVLLCDAAFSATPLLNSLKIMGFYVGVCGNRKSDPGHLIADKSHLINYANKTNLKKVFIENNYDYLVPGCTDISYLVSSNIANDLSLPGYEKYEISRIIHDKLAFREFLKIHKYPIPNFTYSFEKVKGLNFPILTKPTNLYSGLEIKKYLTIQDFNRSFSKDNEPNKSYIYEEFITGDLYSHSAFIQNGIIAEDYFVNEYCTINPYQVNSSNLSFDLNTKIISKIRLTINRIIKDLKLKNGLFHTQLIVQGESFWIIESCRRCPGDLYSKLIELSTGVNYSDQYVASFCRVKKTNPQVKRATRFFSRHTLSVSSSCIFNGAKLNLKAESIITIPLKKTGERLLEAPLDRGVILFLEFKKKEMLKNTKELSKLIEVYKI